MNKLKHRIPLALLGMVVLAACDDQGPAAPQANGLLTPDEAIELAVLADNEAVNAALDLVTTNTNVGMRRGRPHASEGRELTERARVRFAKAQESLRSGEHRVALEEARQARRLVARGIAASGGPRAVQSLVEHLESVAFTAMADPGAFDDAGAVAAELSQMAGTARAALMRGDTVGAGAGAIFGEQRSRNRRGHHGRPGRIGEERAELALELGGTAVALAERLLDEQGADDEQLRFLATAHEFLESARTAFAEGEYARAAHLAGQANWNALKAVVLPGGVTVEEAREMVELATGLLEEAEVALGDSPTPLQMELFERAERLIELGEDKVGAGQHRGVAALWRGAVISSWLIG